MVKLKRKDGRPLMDSIITKKYREILRVIPDDGTQIRFKEISERLPGMSRSTISRALKFFTTIGIIIKSHHNRKAVFYHKLKNTFYPRETTQKCLERMRELGVDEVEQVGLLVTNYRTPRDILLEIRNKGNREALTIAQSILLNDALHFIETRLLMTLRDYAKEPNKNKKIKDFNNEIQFIHTSLVERLTEFIDDIGLDSDVLGVLFLTGRRELKNKHFNQVKLIKEHFDATDSEKLVNNIKVVNNIFTMIDVLSTIASKDRFAEKRAEEVEIRAKKGG